MKSRLLVCVAIVASVFTLFARDITTVAGQTYHDVKVARVEKAGVAITHRDGLAFLELAVLPADIRAEFFPIEKDPDAIQPSPEIARISELITLDHVIYRDVTITRIERTGLRISHRAGNGFVDYVNLPDQIRRKYGFTDAGYAEGKAAQHQREVEAAEAQQRFIAATAARTAEVRKREEEARSNALLLATLQTKVRESSAIATRDYSANSYNNRDYTSNRYVGRDYSGGVIHVRGYTRKDGTYVRPHTRRK